MKSAQDKQNVAFQNVWGKDVSAFEAQVRNLWKQHGGPIGVSAGNRLSQLALIIKDPDDKVVGMSTAFKVHVKQLRNYFFAIRLLIAPEFRIPGLTSKLLVLTRDFLESIHHQEVPPAIGVITLVENQRMKEKRNEAIWPASGMVYIGNSGEGHHIRVYYFKDARIMP
jgi:hypothetical protein